MRASLLHLTCAAALLLPLQASAQFTEGFDDVNALPGWVRQNNSQPAGSLGWTQGIPDPTVFFTAFSGAPDSYLASSFLAVDLAALEEAMDLDPAFTGTLSNWLLTPELSLYNGASFSFLTRTVTPSLLPGILPLPDRLQLRLSTAGSSTDVGDEASSVGAFTTLLLDINPTLGSEYPTEWTAFSVSLSGLTAPVTGRFAFRHFVDDVANNGLYVGIDDVSYAVLPLMVPEPGSLMLLSAGMIGFAVRRRRKGT